MRIPTTARLAPVALATLALVAPASARAEACPNEGVRSQQGVQDGSAHPLPACRAYELASPAQKNEQEVNAPDRFVREVSFQAAERLAAVQYTLTGAVPGSESGGLYGAALSYGGEPGSPWQTIPLEPDNHYEGLHGSGEVAGEFEHFSPELSCGIESTRLPLPPFDDGDEAPQLAPGESAEEDIQNLYEWNAPGEYTLITGTRPSEPALSSEGPVYFVDGASGDCGVVLYSNDKPGYSLPGAPEASMYEWSEGESAAACRQHPEGCAPKLASVLPDGKDATDVVDPEAGEAFSNLNEVSASGSRMFFTAASDGGEPAESVDAGALQIYLREDGQTKRAISLSQTATAVRDSGAKFQAASREGERVFFLANYGLTGSDGGSGPTSCTLTGSGEGTGCDLYEYDLQSGVLSDLSSDASDAGGADVRGVIGIAEDGSSVYFSASGQLLPGAGNSEAQNEATSGENHLGAQKTEAEANVYGYYEGALHYVATIGQIEAGSPTSGSDLKDEVDSLSGTKGMHYEAARVSENGEYLMLATRYPLTSYDNTQTGTSTRAWEEYEYASAGGELDCVSCNPSGEAPGPDSREGFSPLGVYIAIQDGVIPRNLANDGRVFFDSYQALQTDVDGTLFAPADETVNVYEWSPEGLGECTPPGGLHGCLALLDSATSSFPTYFEGAAVDGQSVYVTTHAALAPQDEDELADIYDVRVDGGTPASPARSECSEELPTCSSAEAGLAPGSYASEAPSGDGNLLSVPTPQPIVEVPSEGVKAYAARKVKGTSVSVAVSAAAAGRLTASGTGFATVRRVVSEPGLYRLRVALTAAEKRLLKRRRKLKLNLKLSFIPARGKPSAATVSVTFV